MEDPKADAAVARPRDRFDLAVANGDGLVLALDPARVGVGSASPRAEIDEVRQLRVALGHARRLVSGTCRRSRGSSTLRAQQTARATTNAFVMDALAYRPRFGGTKTREPKSVWARVSF